MRRYNKLVLSQLNFYDAAIADNVSILVGKNYWNLDLNLGFGIGLGRDFESL